MTNSVEAVSIAGSALARWFVSADLRKVSFSALDKKLYVIVIDITSSRDFSLWLRMDLRVLHFIRISANRLNANETSL